MAHYKVLHLKKKLRYFALFIEKKAIAILCKLHCTISSTKILILFTFYQHPRDARATHKRRRILNVQEVLLLRKGPTDSESDVTLASHF